MNTYYYYWRCCCCRWWRLLLGLLVLRPSISSLLLSATSVITKCDSFSYYKVRWSVITKCDSFFITKCDKCDYKVRQVLQSVTILLQSATIITKCDSTLRCTIRGGDVFFKLSADQFLVSNWSQAQVRFLKGGIKFAFCLQQELNYLRKALLNIPQELRFWPWLNILLKAVPWVFVVKPKSYANVGSVPLACIILIEVN